MFNQRKIEKRVERSAGRGALGLICSVCIVAILAASCQTSFQAGNGTVLLKDDSLEYSIVGSNKDGFDAPDGILWKDGKIYMADEGGAAFRIWKDSKNVRTLSDSGDGLQSPEDFVLDKNGNIYFTDDDAGGLWKTDHNGKTVQIAGLEQGLKSTEGIALMPSGDILVGDGESHRIFKVGTNGTVNVFLDVDAGIKKAESMVFDSRGNLYIADNKDQIIYLMTPDRKLTRLIENLDRFSPETIWIDDDELFITDRINSKLLRYSQKDGLRTIAEFGGIYSKLAGVTTDDRGRIYVSIQTHIDRKQSYILRFEDKATGQTQNEAN